MRIGDASMTYTEAGNYDFMTAEVLTRGGPRYGSRFDSREGVVGTLLLPEGAPVGGHVFTEEHCKICFIGRRRGFIRRRDVAVLASLSTISFPGMLS